MVTETPATAAVRGPDKRQLLSHGTARGPRDSGVLPGRDTHRLGQQPRLARATLAQHKQPAGALAVIITRDQPPVGSTLA
jgi:hypothetical protein